MITLQIIFYVDISNGTKQINQSPSYVDKMHNNCYKQGGENRFLLNKLI